MPQDPPQQLDYVGPLACISTPWIACRLPWAPGDRRPLVVSYSTSFQNQVAMLRRVADAVADRPAIVEEPFTTIVVYPGQTARLDAFGTYRIEL